MSLSQILKLIQKSELDDFLPVTRSIVDEAWKKDIEVYRVLPNLSFLLLKKGNVEKWYYPGRTSDDNRAIPALTRNKFFTKEFLSIMNVPVPEGRVVTKVKELYKAAKEFGYPLVVKPLNGQEGLAVIINIQTKPLLLKAFRIAKHYDENIMVEKYYPGYYYRILVIDHKYFATARAHGAQVVGDGKHNVSKLIKFENRNPERKKGGRLKKIRLNLKARRLLLGQNMDFKSVPPAGQKVTLSFSGADGGEWVDVTEEVHPINIALFNEIAKNLDLGMAGIDFLSPDISKPYNENNAVVIEVNSAPDIDLHQRPTSGTPRNAARAIINMLFGD